MKKVLVFLLSLSVLSLLSFAKETKFTKMASGKPELTQQGKQKMWCPVCGMNLKMFYKTSHASKIEGKIDRQYCSMRCLVVDMQKHKIDTKDIKVVDVTSEKLIDAEKAYYVLGSKVPGTMSKISKLAFAKKEDALAFAKKMGGRVVDFFTALKSAKESLKTDIAMTNKKKQKKMYPMGKKIFEKMCSHTIDPTKYDQINTLKADIKTNKLCKPLKEKQLQAVTLYLWEVKRVGKIAKNNTVKVTKDEKCPVCGMFVYKYPRWAAQIFFKMDGHEHHLSFDGVKDLMKFYFEPQTWGNFANVKENITKILVTDYYSQKAIDGKKAFFVVGSDVLGPMGNELIPFEQESDAKTFLKDHRGKKIVRLDQVSKEEVYKLDE